MNSIPRKYTRRSRAADSKWHSPVVRTNPVTGWKSLFGAGHQVRAGWINEITERESEILKDYCKQCGVKELN